MTATQSLPSVALNSIASGFSGPTLIREKELRALSRRVIALGSQMEAGGLSNSGASERKASGYVKDNGVAIIPIIGVLTKYGSPWDSWIGFCPSQPIQCAINEALEDPDVSSILLRIDSPGGTVAGSTELASTVAAANAHKKVYAVISDMCASGAMWIASQCTRIYANDVATVGSIGVYTVWTDDTKFYADLGINFHLISTGKYKGLGADGAVTQDLKDQAQREMNSMFAQFTSAVARGRNMKPEAVAAIADGRCWIGAEAVAVGLVDEILPADEAQAKVVMLNVDSSATTAPPNPGGSWTRARDQARQTAGIAWDQGKIDRTKWTDKAAYVAFAGIQAAREARA